MSRTKSGQFGTNRDNRLNVKSSSADWGENGKSGTSGTPPLKGGVSPVVPLSVPVTPSRQGWTNDDDNYVEKVTQDTVKRIAVRDNYRCIAPLIDGKAGFCHDRWGNLITRWSDARVIDRDKATIAHVKGAGEQAMGKRASSDELHLLILCWGHHEGMGEKAGYCWGTSREGLDKQRRYLEQFAPLPRENMR